MKLSHGQQIKIRMIGSNKIQSAIVYGHSDNQYIEVKSNIPFKINVDSNLTNLYQVII